MKTHLRNLSLLAVAVAAVSILALAPLTAGETPTAKSSAETSATTDGAGCCDNCCCCNQGDKEGGKACARPQSPSADGKSGSGHQHGHQHQATDGQKAGGKDCC